MPKKTKKKNVPKDMQAFCDVNEEDLKKDLKLFIDNNLISHTEVIPYSLSLLYNAINDEEKDELAKIVVDLSKKIDELFTTEVSNKHGTSVAFMFALVYMLANMNVTLMQDEAWRNLTSKGETCRAMVLGQISGKPTVSKIDVNKGYI